MARSHFAVALGAAIIASLILGQLVINLGFPTPDLWHSRLDQSYGKAQQMHFLGQKQSGEQVDDPSSYLIGVGKADITGYVYQVPLSVNSPDLYPDLWSSSTSWAMPTRRKSGPVCVSASTRARSS